MRHSGLRSPFAALILFAPLVVVSCGDSGTCSGPLCDGTAAASVATVAVTAGTTSLTSVGATMQLQAAAKDTGGNTVTGKTFTWSSLNQDVVTVDTSGLATAVGGGTATITATTDGIGGSLALTVAQTVATIEVTPAGPLTLTSLGATENLTAVAKDNGAAVIAGITFTWASDNQAAATVAADGTVTAVARGVANITAAANGVTSNIVEARVETVDPRYPRFTFASVVRGVVGSPFGQNISVGDSITGTLTYDVQVPGVPGSAATDTSYPQMIVGGITAEVGGRVYSSNSYSIFLGDNVDMAARGVWDGYNISSVFGGDFFEDGVPTGGSIGVASWDVTGLFLSSQSLLDFDPTLFAGQFQLLQDNSNFFQADVTLVAVSQSPEQASR